jgi:hypothetical protein
MKFFLAFFLIIILCISCKKENMCDCLKSTGDVIKESRRIKDFTTLVVHDNIFVTLTQDNVNTVEVEAGENLLPLIKTDVEGETLTITNDNTCNWVRSYKKEIHVYMHVKNLEYIWWYSSKDLTTTNTLTTPIINIFNFFSGSVSVNISADESYTKQMGSGGDMTVTGLTHFNYIFDQGYGFLHLENLQSNRAVIGHHGTGDIYVNASDTLDAEILNAGSVYYSGNPVIIQRTSTGSGKLIHE